MPVSIDLVRKLKGQLDLQQPGVVAGFGSYGVVIGTECQLHGLPAEVKRLAEVAAGRNGPLPAVGDPVCCDLRRRADRPSVAEMIAEAGVQIELVGAARPAKGPDVVDDRAVFPRALILLDERRRRARAPFHRAEYRIPCRGIVEHRADAPVETLAVLGRQKERRIAVAETEGPRLAELLRRERF